MEMEPNIKKKTIIGVAVGVILLLVGTFVVLQMNSSAKLDLDTSVANHMLESVTLETPVPNPSLGHNGKPSNSETAANVKTSSSTDVHSLESASGNTQESDVSFKDKASVDAFTEKTRNYKNPNYSVMEYSINYGSFDISLHNDCSASYRVFFFSDHIQNNESIMKDLITKVSAERFDIPNVFLKSKKYKNVNGKSFYMTEIDNPKAMTAETVERHIRYLGMQKFIENLNDYFLFQWHGRDVYFIVPCKGDNNCKDYDFERKNAESINATYNVLKNLEAKRSYFFGVHHYVVRVVEIKNLFGQENQTALHIDFHNRENQKQIEKQPNDNIFMNSVNYERIFNDVKELKLQPENATVLYSNSRRLADADILKLIDIIRTTGFKLAFDYLFQGFVTFPQTSILLIDTEEKLNELKLKIESDTSLDN